MRIGLAGLDPRWQAIHVVFNATPNTHIEAVSPTPGTRLALHPIQASSSDRVLARAVYDPWRARVTVPARTVAVFVEEPLSEPESVHPP